MPEAKTELTNYPTDTIRDVVRREVLDPVRRREKLYGQPRIWNDLLSSQPLCFNLFGELVAGSASRVFGTLSNGRIADVDRDWVRALSGQRRRQQVHGGPLGLRRFCRVPDTHGRQGVLGIEVKYHEDLEDSPSSHRDRYDEIAANMGGFEPGALEQLKLKPLQQIWRDHLLSGALLLNRDQGYDGFFVFFYPAGNVCCSRAVGAYQTCLADRRSFVAWTLEDVAAAIKVGGPPWIDLVVDRYLAFERTPAE